MANGLFDFKRSTYEVQSKYKEFQDSLEKDLSKNRSLSPIRASLNNQSRGIIADAYYNQNALNGQNQMGYAVSQHNPISVNAPDVPQVQGRFSDMSRQQKTNLLTGAIGDVAGIAGTYYSVLNTPSESEAQDNANTMNLTLNSAVTGAKLGGTVGGPIGAGIGAVIGGVTGFITGNKKANKETRRREYLKYDKQKKEFETRSTAREYEEGMSEAKEEVERLARLRANQLNYINPRF